MFATLGIFAAGCDPAAARAVCDADEAIVALLVDASLVRRDGQRLLMLETIREYAAERLAELDGVDDASRRLAEQLLDVAREAERMHVGRTSRRGWSGSSSSCRTSAWRWVGASNAASAGSASSSAMHSSCSGYAVAGTPRASDGSRRWSRWKATRLRRPSPVRSRRPDAARSNSATSSAAVRGARRPSTSRRRTGTTSTSPGRCTAWATRRPGAATSPTPVRSFGGAATCSPLLGMYGPAGGRETFLAELARSEGDSDEAREAYERSVRSFEAAGDAAGVAGSLQGLGDVALDVGDAETALVHYRAALDRLPPADRPFDLLYVLGGFAAVAAARRQPDAAARLWGAVEKLETDLDHRMHAASRTPYERVLGDLDARLVAAGRRLSPDQAVELARSV